MKTAVGRMTGWIVEWQLRLSQITMKLGALCLPTLAATSRPVREYLFSFANFPPEAECLVDPLHETVSEFDAALKDRKLLVIGESGSGKTTFAITMLRRLFEKDSSIPSDRIPVFIQLSRRPSSNLSVFDLISNSVASRRTWLKRLIAWRLMRAGVLFVILDDVDYLDRSGASHMEEFIRTQGENLFVCIVGREPVPSDFWRQFRGIKIPEWGRERVIAYIEKRISDPVRCFDLIRNMERVGILARQLSAMTWKCFIDNFDQGRVFELFHPHGVHHAIQYKLQNTHHKILLDRYSVAPHEREEIGKLALKLLKEGRSSFGPDEIDLSLELLLRLTPDIFVTHGSDFAFAAKMNQAILAGKYLGENWGAVRSSLDGPSAKRLVWTSLFNCALPFIDPALIPQLRAAFQRLAFATSTEDCSNIPVRPPRTAAKGAERTAISEEGGPVPTSRVTDPLTHEVAALESVSQQAFDGSGIDRNRGLNGLGRLSLDQLSKGRITFSASEAEASVGREFWLQLRPAIARPEEAMAERKPPATHKLVSGLLVERENEFGFAQPNIQAYFGGRFIGECWPEASTVLHQAPVGTPLLQKVHSFARYFIDKALIPELDDLFRNRLNLDLPTTQPVSVEEDPSFGEWIPRNQLRIQLLNEKYLGPKTLGSDEETALAALQAEARTRIRNARKLDLDRLKRLMSSQENAS